MDSECGAYPTNPSIVSGPRRTHPRGALTPAPHAHRRAQMLTVSLPSAVRRVGTSSTAVEPDRPPLSGYFLRLRSFTIFSGLLRPGLSDYERSRRPDPRKKHQSSIEGLGCAREKKSRANSYLPRPLAFAPNSCRCTPICGRLTSILMFFLPRVVQPLSREQLT